jgi:hypothetical protein
LTQTTSSTKIATKKKIPDLAPTPLHAAECSAIAIAAHEPRTSSKKEAAAERGNKERREEAFQRMCCLLMDESFGVGKCWMIVTSAYLIDK